MGPIIVPPGGHSVPSTPPVVTIAPTKTVNGVWRSESRQVSAWDAGWSRGWPQAVHVGGGWKVAFGREDRISGFKPLTPRLALS